MADDEKGAEESGDPRVGGLITVGWVSLAMLGICIPLVAIIGAFAGPWATALPAGIVLGAGLMAIFIWRSGSKAVAGDDREKLLARIDELEKRLGNLEMIESIEEHFAEKSRRKSEPGLMGPEQVPPQAASE